MNRYESQMNTLGIDIGGSGIKGAPVDLLTGELIAPRYRLPTPIPAKPDHMASVIAKIVQHFSWENPIGYGYPGVVRNGVTLTAANLHKRWIGLNAAELFQNVTNCAGHILNDADAAGLAEMTFGIGRGHKGVVIIITVGTGIGTAIFTDGMLVPNCELGHIKMNGEDAETLTSDAVRQRDNLSWKQWALRFNGYLRYLEFLLWPDLFILGGGISKQYDKFIAYLNVQAEILPAQLLNNAGIVGAALAARSLLPLESSNSTSNATANDPTFSQSP
jgi:polyphosphate glucokinase